MNCLRTTRSLTLPVLTPFGRSPILDRVLLRQRHRVGRHVFRWLACSLTIETASATKRRFEMKSHCRLVLILAIAYSLLGLLSYTAQTKVKSADEARAAQINDGSERVLLAERSLDGNPGFDLHFNHLASPALAEAGLT